MASAGNTLNGLHERSLSAVAWRSQTDTFTTKRQYGTDWPEPPPVSYPYGLCVFSHKDSIECPSQ
ncbi:hypothetical protein SAMN03159453_03139 [Pseudomonas sp. NFIX28]|nr:hypothetical protein SAMN03159453_03139 [Pseudomonas sp. NFIX28]